MATEVPQGTLPKGALVMVVWDDACFQPGEIDPELMEDEYPMLTLGFVVRETEKSLFVAGEFSPPNVYRAVSRIPWAGIIDLVSLVTVDQAEAEKITPVKITPICDHEHGVCFGVQVLDEELLTAEFQGPFA